MSLPVSCIESITAHTGTRLEHFEILSGGDISTAFLATAESGKQFCVKFSTDLPIVAYQAEQIGLDALRKGTSLTVPEVLCTFSSVDGAGIVLELLRESAKNTQFYEQLAQGLAELHSVKAGSFGFNSDNFIGSIPQSNKWHKGWGDFFCSERLDVQMKLARKVGWVTEKEYMSFLKKLPTLVGVFNALGGPAVLLHGDLWSGNALATSTGAALIDPAVYYGNREAEIAFTELFGGFSDSFYAAYRERLPFESGYTERRDIYNLYHILNHANMFGNAYFERARNILRRL